MNLLCTFNLRPVSRGLVFLDVLHLVIISSLVIGGIGYHYHFLLLLVFIKD